MGGHPAGWMGNKYFGPVGQRYHGSEHRAGGGDYGGGACRQDSHLRGYHSLALCSDGTLAAWGSNNYGQFGTGGTVDSNVPVAAGAAGVLLGKTVIALAGGGYSSLALCADGTLAGWGDNSSGQLGNGSTTASNVPVAVSTAGVLSGKSVIAISAGSSDCLARCSDGTLAAWGGNAYGAS